MSKLYSHKNALLGSLKARKESHSPNKQRSRQKYVSEEDMGIDAMLYQSRIKIPGQLMTSRERWRAAITHAAMTAAKNPRRKGIFNS